MTENTERQRRYRKKNKYVGAWIPQTLADAFLEYLKKYSYGDSDTQRFRVFIIELLRLEKDGITIKNLQKTKEQEFRERLEKHFGEVTEAMHICVRLPKGSIEKMTVRDREITCLYCKEYFPAEFKACQELKAEFTETSSKEQKT